MWGFGVEENIEIGGSGLKESIDVVVVVDEVVVVGAMRLSGSSCRGHRNIGR